MDFLKQTETPANPKYELTFVDFLPQFKRKNFGLFSQAGYESFSDLLKRINAWLKKNQKWKAVSFETFAYDFDGKFKRRNSLCNKKKCKNELRGLRMWIVSKDIKLPVQKIGCLVIAPKIKEANNSQKSSRKNSMDALQNLNCQTANNDVSENVLIQKCAVNKNDNIELLRIPHILKQHRLSLAEILDNNQVPLENLDDTINNLNEYLVDEQLQGRFLSVECAKIPMKQDTLNVDSVFFPHSTYGACDQVYVLRIYYEISNYQMHEKLHCKDFVPKQVYDTYQRQPLHSFETFDGLWKHVKAHFACNRKRSFLSAQTMSAPLADNGEPLDSQNMLVHSNDDSQNHINFLRIFYTTPRHHDTSGDEWEATNEFGLKVNCKQFIPHLFEGKQFKFQFEGLPSSKKRLESWVFRNEIKCLSGETVYVTMAHVDNQAEKAAQNCVEIVPNRKSPANFVTIFRVYYVGERVIEAHNEFEALVQECKVKNKNCSIQ